MWTALAVPMTLRKPPPEGHAFAHMFEFSRRIEIVVEPLRAPTFLMVTGYEQVRAVVAELASDFVAARQVQLVLPETGVCSVTPAALGASICCGGPAASESSCCAADEVAKSTGEPGCGCGSTATPPQVSELA